MAIAYKSQGAGVATETSGAALSPACPATVDANDILIAHVYWEGTATAPSTPAGWTLLSGPHVIETSISRHWVFGKIAAGTEDGATVAFGNPAVTTQRGARIYSFSGWANGTIESVTGGFAHQSNATDPAAPTVGPSPAKAGTLAVLLVGQNDNNTFASFTGESGGNYTEAVAEFTAALTPGLALGIQTSSFNSVGGTITGGVDSTANDPVGVIGFYIWDGDMTSSESLTMGGLAEGAAILATLKDQPNDAVSRLDDNAQLLLALRTSDTELSKLDDPDLVLVSLEGPGGTGLNDTASQLTDAATLDTGAATDKTGAELLTVGPSEDATLKALLTASDTLTANPTEQTVLRETVDTADAATANPTEAATAQATLAANDSLPAGLTEAATLTGVNIFTGDSATATPAEDARSVLLSQREDTASQLAEQVTGFVAAQAAEDVPAHLTEATQLDAGGITAISGSDEAHAGLTEDTASTLLASVNDSLSGLAETATGSATGSASDSLGGLSENVIIAVTVATADSLVVSVADAFNQILVAASGGEDMAGLAEDVRSALTARTEDSLGSVDDVVQLVLGILVTDEQVAVRLTETVVDVGEPAATQQNYVVADALGFLAEQATVHPFIPADLAVVLTADFVGALTARGTALTAEAQFTGAAAAYEGAAQAADYTGGEQRASLVEV